MPRPRARRPWRLVAIAVALVALPLPLTTLVAGASDARISVAGLAPVPTKDVVVNKVITTSFDLALRQQHAGELSSFIASLSNTASTNYHRFLTPREYAQRFGASAATVNAVRTYFQQYGLHVGALSAGHNVLHVTGTTTEIARAFDSPVETVSLAGGVLDAHFTATASLPHALGRDVTAVAGLSTVAPEVTNVSLSHAVATAGTCVSAGPSSGTQPNSVGGYTLQQQAELYGLNTEWSTGNTGVGQTIGVYELATYNASDVATYTSCYSLSPSITSINVDGGPTSTDNADNAPDEATLDVEETAGLAPGADIEVYQGTQNGSGPTDIYSEIASQDSATIITTSWGICEQDTDGSAQVEQPIFEEMAAQGQTVVAAAGDDGSSDCEDVQGGSTSALAVDDPSSQPYVTGVGGLTVNDINPLSETVWNDDCTSQNCGAGGGGVSTLWSRPTWQVAPGINTATETMRMVPDLSVMAAPSTGFIQYYTGTGSGFCQHSCSGGWGGIGGTSIGAPLVSSLLATAAQACGISRLGFVNPELYAMATTGYVDVTTGTNDLYNVGEYSAGPGYDMASGLGSPDGAAFFAGLCPASYSPTESSFAVSSLTGVVDTAGPTITATLRSTDGDPLTDAQVNVSASAPGGPLSIDQVDGAAASPGSASSTVTSNASGVVSFSVGSGVAQNVDVTVTYEDQTIYAATLTFKLTASATVPSAPSIAKLTPLVGGFSLIIKPPTSSGGSAVTWYQYSLNGGKTWTALVKGSRSIDVTRLARSKAYRVYTRALNDVGASHASASKVVVTRS
ncbi:MAG: S53 family peptidase [Acidimicrobiales bacterium]